MYSHHQWNLFKYIRSGQKRKLLLVEKKEKNNLDFVLGEIKQILFRIVFRAFLLNIHVLEEKKLLRLSRKVQSLNIRNL